NIISAIFLAMRSVSAFNVFTILRRIEKIIFLGKRSQHLIVVWHNGIQSIVKFKFPVFDSFHTNFTEIKMLQETLFKIVFSYSASRRGISKVKHFALCKWNNCTIWPRFASILFTHIFYKQCIKSHYSSTSTVSSE